MNKPFNLERALAGDPVVTRDGRPVKIAGYNKDAHKNAEIIGWVEMMPESWCANGSYAYMDTATKDLFMAPTERKEWVVKTPVSVNMTVGGVSCSRCLFGPFDSFESAKYTADSLKGFVHEIIIPE